MRATTASRFPRLPGVAGLSQQKGFSRWRFSSYARRQRACCTEKLLYQEGTIDCYLLPIDTVLFRLGMSLMNCTARVTLGVWIALFCLFPCHLFAAQRVEIVVGQTTDSIDQFAATELKQQLERLFEVEAKISTTWSGKTPHTILLGNSPQNVAMAQKMGIEYPKLTPQGIALKSFRSGNGTFLLVEGGSPVATLWAVYELGNHWGIRYLLSGDIIPEKRKAIDLGRIDLIMEPEIKVRSFQTVDASAFGFESWGLADQQKLIHQLAKLKYNNLMIVVHPWQPFVHYEFGGINKQTGVLWWGERYRVDGDTPGRQALGGAKWFENPDFAGKESYEARTAAGQKLLRGIIEAAHRVGMTVGLSLSPLEFPREFQSILANSVSVNHSNRLLIAPGSGQRFEDQALADLVKAKIHAYLRTYPGLDEICFRLPASTKWGAQTPLAWKAILNGNNAKVGQSFSDLLARTESQYRQAMQENLVALAFLQRLLKQENLLKSPSGKKVQPFVTGISPALFPVLEQVIPARTSVLHYIDHSARRVARKKQLLERIPARKIPSRLVLTLSDTSISALSQSAISDIESLLDELRMMKWEGFSAQVCTIGDLDPAIDYLPRAAFDGKLTAKKSYRDFFLGITDNPAATDRIWLGYLAVEKATQIIDGNSSHFAFPERGMLLKHATPEPIPQWWQAATDEYNTDLVELYRTYDSLIGRSRPLFYYYAKRSEFMLSYMGAVKAIREAALAKKGGDIEKQIEHLEAAIESMYDGLDTLGDIARNPSDRGMIAVLNAYAYQPLLAEYEKVLDESEN